MKTKTHTAMTNLTTTQSKSISQVSTSTVLYSIGLIVMSILALVSMVSWNSPICFFTFLAGAFYCIDPIRAAFR
jgi:hypothetical protein